MNTILQALIEAAQKRADNWTNIKVRKFPDVELLQEVTMLGSHSFALVQTRRRLIKEKIVLDEQHYETPSAIARDYLRIIYKRGPNYIKVQGDLVEGVPPVPSYAKPGKFAHGFYIDIRAAYWSIMQITGWDVDYCPGFWLSPGRPPSDFPFPEHKIARNCLVSAGRLSGIPRFDPRKLPGNPFDEIFRGSDLKNNQLPRLIHDLLNCIAYQAIKAGAVYVNNDGFIAPTPNIADKIIEIVANWGLPASIKAQGSGEVKASGTYRIGIQRTLNYETVHEPQPLDNIFKPSYFKWLEREFAFFAARGNPL